MCVCACVPAPAPQMLQVAAMCLVLAGNAAVMCVFVFVS